LTDSSYTHILAIVDRSGSMTSSAREMRAALDSFFKDQAGNDGKCLVDYSMFDHQYEVVFTDRPVAEAEAVLSPRGSTALLDAVGKGVTELGTKLALKPEHERPGLVQVVVVTDGYENASQEWNAEGIRKLIKDQESKYNWDFVFLGANMDAQQVGADFGFARGKSLTYDINNPGAMSASLSNYTTGTRSAAASGDAVAVASAGFSDEDREANS
jgi:hypothetical protein